jgi:CDP-paratose 2-epimerase
MKVLITGVCGFVGSTIARGLRTAMPEIEIVGIDSLVRPGSELHRAALSGEGVSLRHADIRCASDVDTLPAVDWVIDAAANPSVLAGVDGSVSSRQLVEHNLYGTVNVLEFCARHGAGFILLSTSRVYSITALSALPVEYVSDGFRLRTDRALPPGVSPLGLDESFSSAAPVSLYGCAKLASEALALEYGSAFGFPVWINRCGVLAGAGQFGRSDQGIFSFWINSWLRRQPLKYIGFGGSGRQVRDCLHPRDLVSLLVQQMEGRRASGPRVFNLGGGAGAAMSLAQLSAWCERRFGSRVVEAEPQDRPFDVPWLVMDSSRAETAWGWRPATPLASILDEIAKHAEQHPEWLDVSRGPSQPA